MQPNYRKLNHIARQRGLTVLELLNETFREHPTVRSAAEALGIYPISINWWLSVNGYEVVKTAKVVKAKPEFIEASQS